MPLVPAARALALLQDHLDLPDAEWDVLYFLRELCLGRSIEHDQLQTLKSVNLITTDGEIDSTLKSIVLAAVRGSGRVLHIDSPFVERIDQRIAEFVSARDYLQVELSHEEFRQLIDGESMLDRVRQTLEDMPLPHGLEDSEGFARRIRERTNKKPNDPTP